MSVEDENAWVEYQQWRSDEGGYGRPGDESSFMAGRASQRSRIAALEAVIERALEALVVVQTVDGWVDPIDRARAIAKARDTLSAAPSTVLDGMIREAKAEAIEAIRAELINPRAMWWSHFEGPMVQVDDDTAHKIPHDQWLAERAAAYRNGDAS